MEYPGEKLIIKLWETIADKGIGSLLSPWQIKREGTARTEVRRGELLMFAQVEMEVKSIRGHRNKSIADDSFDNLLKNQDEIVASNITSEIKDHMTLDSLMKASLKKEKVRLAMEEINVNKALFAAENVLINDPEEPTEQDVEEDWLFGWRRYASRVSTEELQRLWGNILAGEIKSPGTYSYRTLEFLKGLSKKEAVQISLIAPYVIEGVIFRNQKDLMEKSGISFDDMLDMQTLGVLSGVESIGLEITWGSSVEGKFLKALRSNGKVIIIEHDSILLAKAQTYQLTPVGKQLLRLGDFVPNIEYLRSIGKQYAQQGFKVLLADYRQTSESELEYLNAEAIGK